MLLPPKLFEVLQIITPRNNSRVEGYVQILLRTEWMILETRVYIDEEFLGSMEEITINYHRFTINTMDWNDGPHLIEISITFRNHPEKAILSLPLEFDNGRAAVTMPLMQYYWISPLTAVVLIALTYALRRRKVE